MMMFTLAYVVQSKLDRLANVKRDCFYRLGVSVISTEANALAVTAATKALLVTAGVAVEATASTALTAAGGIGVAIGGGTGVIGVGVLVYQHRYDIEYGGKSAGLAAKRLVAQAQLKIAERTHSEANKRLLQIEKEQQKIQKILQSLHSKGMPAIAATHNPIKSLGAKEKTSRNALETMIKLAEEMNEVSTRSATEKKELEKEIQSIDEKKQDVSIERKLKNYRKKILLLRPENAGRDKKRA